MKKINSALSTIEAGTEIIKGLMGLNVNSFSNSKFKINVNIAGDKSELDNCVCAGVTKNVNKITKR